MNYKILGIANIIIGIFFLFPLLFVTAVYDSDIPIALKYLNILVYFVPTFINFSIAYKTLIKKSQKIPFYLYLALTSATVLWYFLGLSAEQNRFMAYPILLPALVFFYALHKLSLKTAVKVLVVTVIISAAIALTSFEEGYCWRMWDTIEDVDQCHQTFNLKKAWEGRK